MIIQTQSKQYLKIGDVDKTFNGSSIGIGGDENLLIIEFGNDRIELGPGAITIISGGQAYGYSFPRENGPVLVGKIELGSDGKEYIKSNDDAGDFYIPVLRTKP